jgi:hypothetical protein
MIRGLAHRATWDHHRGACTRSRFVVCGSCFEHDLATGENSRSVGRRGQAEPVVAG